MCNPDEPTSKASPGATTERIRPWAWISPLVLGSCFRSARLVRGFCSSCSRLSALWEASTCSAVPRPGPPVCPRVPGGHPADGAGQAAVVDGGGGHDYIVTMGAAGTLVRVYRRKAVEEFDSNRETRARVSGRCGQGGDCRGLSGCRDHDLRDRSREGRGLGRAAGGDLAQPGAGRASISRPGRSGTRSLCNRWFSGCGSRGLG